LRLPPVASAKLQKSDNPAKIEIYCARALTNPTLKENNKGLFSFINEMRRLLDRVAAVKESAKNGIRAEESQQIVESKQPWKSSASRW
jgi:hypothetical protein